jgi:hypothetical protein
MEGEEFRKDREREREREIKRIKGFYEDKIRQV